MPLILCIPLAVSCFVAIHNIVLSLLNIIVHKAKPADNVEIPNCLDLLIIQNLLLLTSFNNRYPTDTISNPLLVAQPVLVSAAKDLVELDGAKQIIVLKDSSIITLESKVTVKDSIIGKYANKELNYKNIILNKDKEITGWEGQYQKLELQYNKLKVKSKFQRIGSYIVIGGLAYLMLAK